MSVMYVAFCEVCGGAALLVVADEKRTGLAAQAVAQAIRKGMRVEAREREAAVTLSLCHCGLEEVGSVEDDGMGPLFEGRMKVLVKEACTVLGEDRMPGEVIEVPVTVGESMVRAGRGVEVGSSE